MSPQLKRHRVRPRVQITCDEEKSEGVTRGTPVCRRRPGRPGRHPDPDADPPRPSGTQKVRRNRSRLLRPADGCHQAAAGPAGTDELQKDGTSIAVELHFRRIEDFEPVNVVRQVDPLRKLLEARQRLAELNLGRELPTGRTARSSGSSTTTGRC